MVHNKTINTHPVSANVTQLLICGYVEDEENGYKMWVL